MNTHSITIAWDASPGPISGYNIYRGAVLGNQSDVCINSALILVPTYTDNSVVAGQEYSYAVTAVRDGIESDSSADILCVANPQPSTSALDLGSAASFAVLSGEKVSNVPTSITTISGGDVGVSPGTEITGLDSPSRVSGSLHGGDSAAEIAQAALRSAFASGMALEGHSMDGNDTDLPPDGYDDGYDGEGDGYSDGYDDGYDGSHDDDCDYDEYDSEWDDHNHSHRHGRRHHRRHKHKGYRGRGRGDSHRINNLDNFDTLGLNLGDGVVISSNMSGQPFAPGVYVSSASLAITDDLVLDANNDPNASWVFKVLGSLFTSAGNVTLAGGANAANVFWIVADSVTLGEGTSFVGNILAKGSISVCTGAKITGRLLCQNGTVSLDGNECLVPDGDVPTSPPDSTQPAPPQNLHKV